MVFLRHVSRVTFFPVTRHVSRVTFFSVTLQVEMENTAILAPVILSFFILVMPSWIRFIYTLGVTSFIILLTSVPAVGVLLHPAGFPQTFTAGGFLGTITFTIDGLSAFFILITNFTVLTGLLYSNGYLRSYRTSKTPAQFALHYFSYSWLHITMLCVLMLRDGTAFLVAWELMAVSSFMLILFEAEKRETLKTAVNYLIQMHVGLVLLIIGFLLAEDSTGEFGFQGVQRYFVNHANAPLFFLFFAGFAVKAGFIPFHTWLPEAHPAAPSHVSGVMSGVMIKMGIFGIVRMVTYVQSDAYLIGIIIMIIASFTGLYGIMMSIVQTDLKKLLAYSTIENIGIIGMGLGLGTIGLGSVLTILGFGGGLFHALNHSLFKSLLFYCAGSVYKATHSRNIEMLGGLIHKMPRTAALFLFGAMAICALPPLNGFISEILIYYGLFAGMQAGSVFQTMSMLLSVIALALIGGLALFGFSKAFGLAFLGSPRSEIHVEENAVSPGMLFPKLLIAAVILLIGLAPMLFLSPLTGLIGTLFQVNTDQVMQPLIHAFSKMSLMAILLILIIAVILIVRNRALKPSRVAYGPTWGCGYTAGTSRQQYTATSYAANFAELANPVFARKVDYIEIHEEDIFPGKRSFSLLPVDIFRATLGKVTDFSMLALKKIARLQTGNIQHYILYAFVFILLIFILLYMNLL
ncbi:MAG: proton-conducting transporter membrane subunit [Bacteroidetes bacterium]|nr:proton-conducting transporter membrane subunit [Bacteroidota bacterium]